MDRELFEHHLVTASGRGKTPASSSVGAAGGAACGDLIRLSVAVVADRVSDVGFEASGCGATIAAGSAVVTLAKDAPLLAAARIGAKQIAEELGGLSPAKLHAAELAADAFARALGAAACNNALLEQKSGRVLVAMSGGVDSAVAALIVMRENREAVGATLELWSDPDNDGSASCCSAQAVRVARSLAHNLGMAHFTVDLRDHFRAGVVQPFLSEHGAGLTPNPCIRCNGHVRLDALLDFAQRLGAQELASGHYARSRKDGLLELARDPNKDQTYMLAALKPSAVARMYFPLGELTKPAVRAIAREAALPVAEKAESQDLCFLAGTGKAAFLAKHGGLSDRPGNIIDRRGNVLGRHRGHHHFTIGQRKGIGVAAAQPLYVLKTNARTNDVTVGVRRELATRTVTVRGAVLHQAGARVTAVKLRYRSRPVCCRLGSSPGSGKHNRLEVQLLEPVAGVAPGQAAVFLAGETIIGWGTISVNAHPSQHSEPRLS